MGVLLYDGRGEAGKDGKAAKLLQQKDKLS